MCCTILTRESINITSVNTLIQYNHGPTEIYRYRKEDDLIAWTWREFLERPDDPNILLRWPMCKGTARAMDAMIELANELRGTEIKEFFMSGQSKVGIAVHNFHYGGKNFRFAAMFFVYSEDGLRGCLRPLMIALSLLLQQFSAVSTCRKFVPPYFTSHYRTLIFKM